MPFNEIRSCRFLGGTSNTDQQATIKAYPDISLPIRHVPFSAHSIRGGCPNCSRRSRRYPLLYAVRLQPRKPTCGGGGASASARCGTRTLRHTHVRGMLGAAPKKHGQQMKNTEVTANLGPEEEERKHHQPDWSRTGTRWESESGALILALTSGILWYSLPSLRTDFLQLLGCFRQLLLVHTFDFDCPADVRAAFECVVWLCLPGRRQSEILEKAISTLRWAVETSQAGKLAGQRPPAWAELRALSLIGSGGFGGVKLVRHTKTGALNAGALIAGAVSRPS
eukprot:4850636-Pleurochrysis_carterae.AAC.4